MDLILVDVGELAAEDVAGDERAVGVEVLAVVQDLKDRGRWLVDPRTFRRHNSKTARYTVSSRSRG
jgi:hypothetical protein